MQRMMVWATMVAGGLVAAGCGGSGGGGGGGGGFGTVSGSSAYTGERGAAAVDSGNAGEFGAVTAEGYEFSAGLDDMVDPSGSSASRAARLGRLLLAPAAEAAGEMTRPEGRSLARSETETVAGNCGGSVTRTTDAPDTLSFPLTATGTAWFSSFCQDGTTLDGSVRYLVTVDQQLNTDATETFSGLTVHQSDAEGGRDLLLTGTVTAAVRGFTGATLDVDLTVEDRADGTMVWFDYTVSAAPGPGYRQTTASLDGSVYHSAYGRVSVTTVPGSSLGGAYAYPAGAVADLVRDDRAELLVSGGILVEGVAGNAALVTVLCAADGDPLDGYRVAVDDAAPRDTFDDADWSSAPTPWE